MSDEPDNETSPFDLNNPETVAKAEKKAARLRAKKLRVVESIMATEDGRAWMFDLLGIYCNTFSENILDGESSARHEGRRAIGLHLLDEIMTAAPEMFWRMRCEAVERHKQ